MAATQHQRDGWLFHPGDHLRNGKSRLDISAYGVQQQQQPIHIVTFLDACQQRQYMLIFCGLYRIRSNLVAFHLADDGQRINISFAGAGHI